MERSPDRGQAVPLVAALLVVATVVALVIVDLGVAAVHSAQARTAADAAALAGAAGGEADARAVAADNGAELVSFTARGRIVEVVVRHGPALARAAAEGIPPVPEGMSPAEAAALERGLCPQGPPTGPVDFAPCSPRSPG